MRPVGSLGSAWDGQVLLCPWGDAASEATCPGQHGTPISVAKSPNCWATFTLNGQTTLDSVMVPRFLYGMLFQDDFIAVGTGWGRSPPVLRSCVEDHVAPPSWFLCLQAGSSGPPNCYPHWPGSTQGGIGAGPAQRTSYSRPNWKRHPGSAPTLEMTVSGPSGHLIQGLLQASCVPSNTGLVLGWFALFFFNWGKQRLKWTERDLVWLVWTVCAYLPQDVCGFALLCCFLFWFVFFSVR